MIFVVWTVLQCCQMSMAREVQNISGTFGTVYLGDTTNPMTEAEEVKASVKLNYKDFGTLGRLWKSHKLTSVEGDGSISSYKVTSELKKHHQGITQNKRYTRDSGGISNIYTPKPINIIYELDDPEAYGAERIKLLNVKFTEIPLIGSKFDEIVKEDWPFKFTGCEFLDLIEEPV